MMWIPKFLRRKRKRLTPEQYATLSARLYSEMSGNLEVLKGVPPKELSLHKPTTGQAITGPVGQAVV